MILLLGISGLNLALGEGLESEETADGKHLSGLFLFSG